MTSQAFPIAALVGRYILLYQPNAAATIRYLLRYVKRGGIIVFHDIDFPDSHPSYPPCPIFDQAYALLGEAFRRAGAPPDLAGAWVKHSSTQDWLSQR